jgi:hypothetical protein
MLLCETYRVCWTRSEPIIEDMALFKQTQPSGDITRSQNISTKQVAATHISVLAK